MTDIQLIVKRNFKDYSNIEHLINDMIKERFSMDVFLANLGSLNDPFAFKDMQMVVELLTKAISEGKNVCIYGDYDVDGTTSVYLSFKTLTKFVELTGSSSKIDYYIPHRETEGYGVNNGALKKIKDSGSDFVITVDCGISCYNQVEYAKSIGLDIIITDHHEYPVNPPECPIISPHDGVYPFYGLSGCGTVFKLMDALFMHNGFSRSYAFEYLDIVAISTVADLVDLKDENRLIVKYGLELLRNNIAKRTRPWLNKLLEVAKFSGSIDATTIGFVIGPRINSVGRLSHSMDSLAYMLSEDDDELTCKALEINDLNDERKEMQDVIVKASNQMIEENGVGNAITLVVEGRVGVVGLAASNILERYYRPVTVFSSSVSPDIYKASARSIEGFNYYEEVIKPNIANGLIVGGGGHAAAAGLAVRKENIEAFRQSVDDAVARCFKKNPNLKVKKVYVDCEVEPDVVNINLYRRVELMAPFGMNNPMPILMLRNLSVIETKAVPVKNPKHLQLILQKDEYIFKSILFKRADLLEEIASYSTIDIAFTMSLNTMFGRTELNLVIEYFSPSQES